jgi:hypothetical protein
MQSVLACSLIHIFFWLHRKDFVYSEWQISVKGTQYRYKYCPEKGFVYCSSLNLVFTVALTLNNLFLSILKQSANIESNLQYYTQISNFFDDDAVIY